MHGHVRELDALSATAAGIAAVFRTAVEPGRVERWQPEHELDPKRGRPGIAVPGTAVPQWELRLCRQPAERQPFQRQPGVWRLGAGRGASATRAAGLAQPGRAARG